MTFAMWTQLHLVFAAASLLTSSVYGFDCQQRDKAGNCLTTISAPDELEPVPGHVLFQSSQTTHIATQAPVDDRFAALEDEFDSAADFKPADESPPTIFEKLSCAGRFVVSTVTGSDDSFAHLDDVFDTKPVRRVQSVQPVPLSVAEEKAAAEVLRPRYAGLLLDVAMGALGAYCLLLLGGQWRNRQQRSAAATRTAAATITEAEYEENLACPNAGVVQLVPPAPPDAAEEEEDIWGCTRLHMMAARGAVEEVKVLLRTGGESVVFAREAWGETPLHMAARHGSQTVCALILAKGADIDAVNDSDETPLLVGAKAGNEEACEFLLSQGASVAGATPDQLPPLLNVLLLKRMILGPARESVRKTIGAEDDEFGCTPLHNAAAAGDESEVEDLLGSRAADVNACEVWDETPLHFAARAGYAGICETLLAHGAEVNAFNFGGKTPVVLAAEARKEDACLLLLAHGAHAGGLSDAEVPPLLAATLAAQIMEDGLALA